MLKHFRIFAALYVKYIKKYVKSKKASFDPDSALLKSDVVTIVSLFWMRLKSVFKERERILRH